MMEKRLTFFGFQFAVALEERRVAQVRDSWLYRRLIRHIRRRGQLNGAAPESSQETTHATNSNSTNPNDMSPSANLLQIISVPLLSQAIYVVAKLGIADLLKHGPKQSDELATCTGTNAQSLYRVLRALASVGLLAEVEEGYFDLAPPTTYLQTGAPDSMRNTTIMVGEEWHWRSWGEILHTVKTGQPAFEHIFGIGLFEYLQQNPEASKIYNDAIASSSTQQFQLHPVIAAYDFSQFCKIVEVGGGYGELIESILKANPTVNGVLFDMPSVVGGAKKQLDASEVAKRCEVVAGNFFKSVPSGGDAYILKTVIHDWDDDHAIAILKNCHRAMAENGRILLIEMVISSDNSSSIAKLLDLELLVLVSGRERTEAEYRALYSAVGFKLTNIIPVQRPLCIIEGVRV